MKKLRLQAFDPKDTGKFKHKEEAIAATEVLLEEMDRLAYRMFAEDKRSLLVVLQGIDAAGKDGLVRHLFTGANPQGMRVYSFKQPSEEELKRDFLWRCHRLVPERGSIAIFNRSYYEDVTTVRVHPEYLAARKLAGKPAKIFSQRYEQINEFERMLEENDTKVLKFFLHISKEEQGERLAERVEDPEKNWKFSPDDLRERKLWHEYQKVFAQMLRETNTKHAPWTVVPADKKWARNYLVTETIVKTLRAMKLELPRLAQKKKIASPP